MPRRCIVKNCQTGSRKHKDNSSYSLFLVPSNKDIREEWKTVIPEIDDAGSQQYVCGRHFESEYIIQRGILCDSSGLMSKRTRLDPKAVPTKFLFDPADTIELFVKECNQEGEYFFETSEHNYAGNQIQEESLSNLIDFSTKLSVMNGSCLNAIENEDDGDEKITSIPLPKSWTVTDLNSEHGERLYFTHVNLNENNLPLVDRCMLVDENRNIQYFIHSKPVLLASKKCPSLLIDVKSLTHILVHFGNQRICKGLEMKELELVPSADKYKDVFETWRHNDCTLLATTKYCTCCCKLVQRMKAKLEKLEKIGFANIQSKELHEKLKVRSLRKKLVCEKRQKERAKAQIESLTNALNAARDEIIALKEVSIQSKCQSMNMNSTEKLVISEIVSAASKKDATGHRYSDEWLNLAMQMSIRSPSYYNFLRDNKILPLPCMKTVNKYSSMMVANSGLEESINSETVVETIQFEQIDSSDHVEYISYV